MDEKINECQNKKLIELPDFDYEGQIAKYVYEYDLLSSDELKRNVLLFEEKRKKVRK